MRTAAVFFVCNNHGRTFNDRLMLVVVVLILFPLQPPHLQVSIDIECNKISRERGIAEKLKITELSL